MLRTRECGHPIRKLEVLFQSGAEASFFVAFLNHETTKKLEFHEILESRILRILWDSTGKSFCGLIPYANYFSAFFCVFLFHSCFRDSIGCENNPNLFSCYAPGSAGIPSENWMYYSRAALGFYFSFVF